MTTVDDIFEDREVAEEAARFWWLFLVSGIAWLVVSLVILRFDIGSVATVAVIFGIVAIFAGIDEFAAIGVSTPGWKVVHGILGVIFVVVGIVAFVRPGEAFAALAAAIGFLLLFKGIFDVTVSFVTKAEFELWWMQLVVGLIEIGLAFWVAGNFRNKVILLVVYTGLVCLSKGLTNLFLAFKLRSGPSGLRPA